MVHTQAVDQPCSGCGVASSVGWIPRTVGEEGIRRLRAHLKGEEAGESEGLTTPRKESFQTTSLCRLEYSEAEWLPQQVWDLELSELVPVEVKEITEDFGVWGAGTLTW